MKVHVNRVLRRVELFVKTEGRLWKSGGRNVVPFLIPAHQTGRARFEHPAFRWTSPLGSRKSRRRPKPKDFKLAKDPLIAIVLGASRLHLMAASSFLQSSSTTTRAYASACFSSTDQPLLPPQVKFEHCQCNQYPDGKPNLGEKGVDLRQPALDTTTGPRAPLRVVVELRLIWP
jgi:hypothetical protein